MRGLQRLSVNCNYVLLLLIRLLMATDDDLAEQNPSCMLLGEDSSKILKEYKSQANKIFKKSDKDLEKLKKIAAQIKEYNRLYDTSFIYLFPHRIQQNLIEYVKVYAKSYVFTKPKHLVKDAWAVFQMDIIAKQKKIEEKIGEIINEIEGRFFGNQKSVTVCSKLESKISDRFNDYKILYSDLREALRTPIVRH